MDYASTQTEGTYLVAELGQKRGHRIEGTIEDEEGAGVLLVVEEGGLALQANLSVDLRDDGKERNVPPWQWRWRRRNWPGNECRASASGWGERREWPKGGGRGGRRTSTERWTICSCSAEKVPALQRERLASDREIEEKRTCCRGWGWSGPCRQGRSRRSTRRPAWRFRRRRPRQWWRASPYQGRCWRLRDGREEEGIQRE